MWTRSELKENAHQNLRRYLVTAILVCIIVQLLSGSSSGNNSNSDSNDGYGNYVNNFDIEDYGISGMPGDVINFAVHSTVNSFASFSPFTIVLVAASMFLAILAFLAAIFLARPVTVGAKRFFLAGREGSNHLRMILFSFRSGVYFNVMVTMLLKDIFNALWYILLVVPGIVKSFEYRMIPYILAENPTIDWRRAFQLSKQMMYGNKFDVFVFDISFFFWHVLGSITCGIAKIVYVRPYVEAANAELYARLREEAIRRGESDTMELPGQYDI